MFVGLPGGVLIISSTIVFIIVLKNAMQESNLRGHPRAMRQAYTDVVEITTSRLLGYLALAVVMGTTWASALAATMANMQMLWYMFIGFNTLQGVLLYAVSVCNKRVFHLIKNKRRVTITEDIRHNGAPLYFTDSKIVDLETSI